MNAYCSSANTRKASSVQYVRSIFAQYYSEHVNCLSVPSSMGKREFAFLLSERKGMIRHKSFEDKHELEQAIIDLVPSDVYYSCAYYTDPTAEMDKKGWLGADLVFDIDADHIPTSCNKVHDEWICAGCAFAGKGVLPDKCPICGETRFDVKSWPCEICLSSARTETIKLLDFLVRDFGLSENELHLFFSGHRGYHVHVESKTIRDLEGAARKEIVDYVLGIGLAETYVDVKGNNSGKSDIRLKSSIGDLGWRGRIAQGVFDLIRDSDLGDFRDIGLGKRVADIIIKDKAEILKNWTSVGSQRFARGVGPETWRKLAESCTQSQTAKIDTVVTTDTHRLIRLTGSLHGKTGFKKTEFPISSINDFDPFKDAIAFMEGTANVFVSDAPEFRLGCRQFGPFKNQEVELPTAAAVLLVCKDRAWIMEDSS